jgi:hypothetical protein
MRGLVVGVFCIAVSLLLLSSGASALEDAGWACESLSYFQSQGFLPEYDSGHFDPAGDLSRMELATATRNLMYALSLAPPDRSLEILSAPLMREFARELAVLDEQAPHYSQQQSLASLERRVQSINSELGMYGVGASACCECDPSPFSGAIRYRVELMQRGELERTLQGLDFILGYHDELLPGLSLNFEIADGDWLGGDGLALGRDALTGDLKLQRAYVQFGD